MTGKKKLPVDTPGEWMKFANENLQVAKHEIEREEPACHTICFLCRESAEKFLKAYLISKGWELKKTHDIVELLEYCSDYDKEFDLLVEDGSILNDYIANRRYLGDITFKTKFLLYALHSITGVTIWRLKISVIIKQFSSPAVPVLLVLRLLNYYSNAAIP